MRVWIVQAKRSLKVYGVFFNEEDAREYCYDNEGFLVMSHRVRGSEQESVDSIEVRNKKVIK